MEQNEEIVLEMKEAKHVDNRLDEISDRNEVVARGVIVSRYDYKSAILIRLMVRGGRRLDKFNYPQFIFAKDAKEAVGDLSRGDHVTITGTMKSSMDKKTGEYKDVILASTIGRTQTKLTELTLERNLGRIRDIPTADFFVAGTVVKSETSGKGVIRLVLKCRLENGQIVYSNFVHFADNLSKVIEFVQVGKRICATGEIQTNKPEPGEANPKHAQTNVITDISSIEDILSIKK